MRSFLFLVVFFLFPYFLTADAFGKGGGMSFPPEPRDYEKLELRLQTVDRGADAYMSGGHSLLRYIDPDHGVDVSFNWGVFSFVMPDFFMQFASGRMLYFMEIMPQGLVSRIYASEMRTLWENVLNLTAAEKKKLWDLMRINYEPENRTYQYNYFSDNCATRIRDLLNKATTDTLKPLWGDRPPLVFPAQTIRQSFLESLRHLPLLNFVVDVFVGRHTDRVMTEWESMYLPKRMQLSLMQVKRPDGQSLLQDTVRVDMQAEAGQESWLLGDERVTLAFPPPFPIKIFGRDLSGHMIVFVCLFMFLVVALFSLFFVLRRRPLTAGIKWLHKIRVVGVSLSWTFLALLGAFVWYFPLFSEHVLTRSNDNMLLLMPFDLVFILPSSWLLARIGVKVWVGLVSIRLLTILVYFASLISSDQDKIRIAFTLAPLLTALLFVRILEGAVVIEQ